MPMAQNSLKPSQPKYYNHTNHLFNVSCLWHKIAPNKLPVLQSHTITHVQCRHCLILFRTQKTLMKSQVLSEDAINTETLKWTQKKTAIQKVLGIVQKHKLYQQQLVAYRKQIPSGLMGQIISNGPETLGKDSLNWTQIARADRSP